MPNSLQLNGHEARLLGVLIEKELTTPEQYPLSLNAATSGANQKSNREPVTDFTEAEVHVGLHGLVMKHLAGRVYGLVVHGDVAGIEGSRRALCDWLDWMGLVDAGAIARLDRYIGYYEPYATSHDALDKDEAVQEEVRNVARAVAKAVVQIRAGTLSDPRKGLAAPRPK